MNLHELKREAAKQRDLAKSKTKEVAALCARIEALTAEIEIHNNAADALDPKPQESTVIPFNRSASK